MDYEKESLRAKRRGRVRRVITYVLLSIWALIVLFPFYWMLLTSVKSYSAYNAEYIPSFFTLSPTLQNYVDAFTTVNLARYFANTVTSLPPMPSRGWIFRGGTWSSGCSSP